MPFQRATGISASKPSASAACAIRFDPSSNSHD
jgi:hypothetical protein